MAVIKNVIAFSLWGEHDVYNLGAVANVVEAKDVYPGWTCRIYVHHRSPVLSRLKAEACEVVPMPDEPQYNPLFWRFHAAADPNLGYAIFRDCDSRVNSREAAAVEEWIQSGQDAHLMKDADAHQGSYVMAGMWGVRGGVFPDMKNLIAHWLSKNAADRKCVDENFLREVIWPRIKDSVISHGRTSVAGPALPFPPHPPMKHGEYVGQVIHP